MPAKKVHVSKRRKTSSGRKISSIEDLKKEGFSIGQTMGDGSYSKVKEAKYKDKQLAVKIINRSKLSEDCKSKFLPREIDILSKISHPNIITVYKIFSYPRRVYIFMEMVTRGNLLNLIRSRGRLVESEAFHYFRQMVSAIGYLQSLNIVHRDLKCENILVTDYDEIKIADFGFCRSAVNEEGKRVLSSTYCGSRAYASPEVIQGTPYNPMMYDVWSLGCVLFIMITGTMPFDDENPRKMLKCQLKKRFDYPDTYLYSKEVKELISRMLEPEVMCRITMKKISKCVWIKNCARNYRPLARPGSSRTALDKVVVPSGEFSPVQADISCVSTNCNLIGKCFCDGRTTRSEPEGR